MTMPLDPALAKPARVLVVDDETLHVKALTDVLRSNSYEAIGCESAEHALATLHRQPCELMIADLVMPRVGGIALIREARQVDPDLGCILMTGHGTLETAIEAMRCGAQDYLLKPLRLNNLLSVVERATLNRRQRSASRQVAETLSQRTRELDATRVDLEVLARGIAHELQHVFTTLDQSFKRLGAIAAQQAELQARLRRASVAAHQLATVVADLGGLAQLEQWPLEKSELDMRALVSNVIEHLRDVGCTELVPVVGDLPVAKADRGLLGHVLRALLARAYECARARPNPTIAIDCARIDGALTYFVRYDVAGAANGFSTERHPSELSPHVAASAPSRAGERQWGSNVALLFARRIVERHGGRLWAAESVAEATTFYFTLDG
jgi:FixJ family two-component response regulator